MNKRLRLFLIRYSTEGTSATPQRLKPFFMPALHHGGMHNTPHTTFLARFAALLALAALFAPVLLQCLACALAFAAAGILAGATGQRQCAQLCRLYFEGARLCGSMLVLYFFMIFLSTALLLLAGNGGLG